MDLAYIALLIIEVAALIGFTASVVWSLMSKGDIRSVICELVFSIVLVVTHIIKLVSEIQFEKDYRLTIVLIILWGVQVVTNSLNLYLRNKY